MAGGNGKGKGKGKQQQQQQQQLQVEEMMKRKKGHKGKGGAGAGAGGGGLFKVLVPVVMAITVAYGASMVSVKSTSSTDASDVSTPTASKVVKNLVESISTTVNSNSMDPLAKIALGKVNNNLEKLEDVKMKLPEIAIEPFVHVKDLGTANFMDFVNETEGKYTMVSFFDPRSESFLVTRRDLEKAAEQIHQHPTLASKVDIGMVNVAVDSYIQSRYSPETLSGWQEDGNKEETKSFLFGKRNFFPIITKLFKDGKPVKEYSDAVRADRIVKFLELHVAENSTVISSAQEGEDFIQNSRPAVIACFPGGDLDSVRGLDLFKSQTPDGGESNEHEQEQLQKQTFLNMTEHFHGWFYYGHMQDEEQCKSLNKEFSKGNVLIVSEDGRVKVFKEHVQDQTIPSVSKYQVSLYNAMTTNRDKVLVELTPDNSWELISKYYFLIVVLADYKDKAQVSKMNSMMSQVGHEALDVEKFKIKYTIANGRNFASQFGLSKDELPNVLIYNTLKDDVIVYSHTHQDPDAVLSNMDVDTGSERLTNFLIETIVPPHLRNATKDGAVGAESRETTNELPQQQEEAAGSLPFSAPAKPESRPQESNVTEAEQVEQDEPEQNEATETSSEKVENEEAPQKQVPKKKKKKRTWTDMRKYQLGSLKLNSMDVGRVWHDFLMLYQEILLFEESYHQMDPTRKAQAENVLLRKILDNCYDYLNTREHLKPIIDTLPKSPADLIEITKNDDVKETFWANLQKLSAYKTNLMQVVDENPDQRNQTLMAFADDYAFLWNTHLDILHQRSVATKERYQKTHGRGPTLEDQRIIEIDYRSAKDLSVEEFVQNYAKKNKPVIISDLHMFKTKWTKSHFAEKCGHYHPRFVQKDPYATSWGGLVGVEESVNLTTFINTHTTNKTRGAWYLHDWGLPRHCPEIIGEAPFDEFYFPKYFAGDYFQRMPFVGYQHSWPSLFIGANGTESSIHIDSGGTNFWMYLIEGEKEWRFYDRFDTIELYQEPGSAHFYMDVFRQDPKSQPTIVNAPMYRGVQKPGDLVFIPGGCPHGVQNFDDIVGISMNYLDVSNEALYLWKQVMEEDFRDYELYANPSFPRGLRKDQKDLTLGEFKSQKWYAMAPEEFDLF